MPRFANKGTQIYHPTSLYSRSSVIDSFVTPLLLGTVAAFAVAAAVARMRDADDDRGVLLLVVAGV